MPTLPEDEPRVGPAGADDLPLVSVIVVTLDAGDWLRRCLHSVARQNYRPLEIMVVDNGSREDVRGLIAAEFPSVQVIRLARNAGFAAGNNAAIRSARGRYVALINNDAVAEPDWIGAMVRAAEEDASVGAVAALILDGNRTGVLDSCGVGIGLDGMSRQCLRGHSPPRLCGPREILVPSGCACLLRCRALADTGLFDERFFAYCEDTDLGLRLRRAGWRAVVAPEAVVTHYYSMTGGKYSLRKVFWVERNHIWVAAKNFPPLLLALVPVTTVWRYLVQAYAVVRRRGDLRSFTTRGRAGHLALTILAAQAAAAIGLPGMLWRRLTFRPRHPLTHLELFRLIWRFRMSAYEIVTGARNARHGSEHVA